MGRKLNEFEIAAYDVLPEELARQVRVFQMPNIGGPFHGTTLGRYIFLGQQTCTEGTSKLLAHELVHVRQWAEFGVIGYLMHYLPDFFSALRRHKKWMAAYHDIPHEIEAYATADDWHNRCQTHTPDEQTEGNHT